MQNFKLKCGILSVVLLALTIHCQAQNLVPNPSFEDYVTCPPSAGGLAIQSPPYESFIANWYSMNLTPDYMHECAGSGASNYPQNNAWGYQDPLDGEGYVAVITKTGFADEREYIAVELNEPLMVGQEYYVSFFASDNDGGEIEMTDCATNNIGVQLFVNPPNFWNTFGNENPLTPTNSSLINHEEILVDSVGWTHIDGQFIAEEPYTHLVIGNFYTDDLTLYQQTNPFGCDAVYYIDYVCVSTSESLCENPTSLNESSYNQGIGLSPNPSYGLIRISSVAESIDQVDVFDSLGRRVMRFIEEGISSIDISELPTGTYNLRCTGSSRIHLYNHLIIKL
jgi:hypothetical protein